MPGTTKHSRQMSSTTTMQNNNKTSGTHAQVCFRCFVIYSNILAIYDEE